MINATFNLIVSLANPASDQTLLTGVIVEVPKIDEQVVVNNTLYIVQSIHWVMSQPDVNGNIAQAAYIRLMSLPA
jgi:hypothetical protein